jgi:uncharacterized protein YdaU (DUF1376 family)
MSAPPYMPFYVGDYLADTGHLTTIEHGAYLLLLSTMWRAGGSLPADDVKLAKYTRMTAGQWSRVKGTILSFFDLENGEITQRRLTRELTKHSEVVRQRRESGSRGGKAKALKNNDVPLANAVAELKQPEPEPKVAKATISDANASSVAGGDVEAAFAGWNQLAGRLGLRVAKDLTPERRRHIRARLASCGLEGWREALSGVERSSHCRGENDRGWRADLDFVCQPKSFQRLREGFYGGDAATETAPDWENFLATWRATGRWPKSLGPPPDHPETQVPETLRAA